MYLPFMTKTGKIIILTENWQFLQRPHGFPQLVWGCQRLGRIVKPPFRNFIFAPCFSCSSSSECVALHAVTTSSRAEFTVSDRHTVNHLRAKKLFLKTLGRLFTSCGAFFCLSAVC